MSSKQFQEKFPGYDYDAWCTSGGSILRRTREIVPTEERKMIRVKPKQGDSYTGIEISIKKK